RLHLTGTGVPSEPVEVQLPAEGAGPRSVRVGPGRTSALVDVDDLPEMHKPGRVGLPAVCNGRIGRPGEVDAWTFAGRKGQLLQVELRASRLGSRLQGVVEVQDGSGKTLRQAEATGAEADPSFVFAVPVDGDYTVRVRDRYRSRGGPGFV